MMNVPKLRFKDDEEPFFHWQESSLLELSSFGFTNGVFNDPTKVGRGYKLINVLDMYIESTINESRLSLVELSESEFKKNKVNYGDIFFTRSSLVKEGIAYSNVYLGNSEDVTFDGHLIRMNPRKDLVNPLFLYYVLRTSKVRKQLVMRGKTATMTTIGQSDIATVNIAYPQLEEQTKIANFLTAVDEKISQLTQKCDLLKQYKKGVMQQIFSQKLRFKDDDGREFSGWEEKKLGEIGEIITGKTPSTTDIELWNGGIQFVTPTDISNNKYQYRTQRTIATTDKLKILPEKSIMFTCIASIGKMALSVHPCVTNQQINSLIPDPSFNNEYVYYALLSITEYIKSTQANTTLPIINKTEFSKFQVPVPSAKEQTKIANFLTAIDDKITQAQTQLEAVKQYKKGLLQQLFV